jgi:hypothetical protein
MAFGMDVRVIKPAKTKKVHFQAVATPSMVITTKSRGNKRERAEEKEARELHLLAQLYEADLPEGVPFDVFKAEKAMDFGRTVVKRLLAEEAQNKREGGCTASCQECHEMHEDHTRNMVQAHAALAQIQWLKAVGANEAVVAKYVEDLLK